MHGPSRRHHFRLPINTEMPDYKKIEKDSSSLNEHRDCAVRAVTAISNLPYSCVHKVFVECGRRRRGGTSFRITRHVLQKLNIWIDRVEIEAKTVSSLKAKLPKKGRFLIRTRGHILAAVNGEILDWTAGRRHRIKEIYKVSF